MDLWLSCLEASYGVRTRGLKRRLSPPVKLASTVIVLVVPRVVLKGQSW